MIMIYISKGVGIVIITLLLIATWLLAIDVYAIIKIIKKGKKQ